MNTMLEHPGVVSFPLGTDSVLLASFIKVKRNSSVCDLGAGTGTLGLLLKSSYSNFNYIGYELDPEAAEAGNRIISERGLCSSMKVICGDIRQISSLCEPGKFDSVISNPPYFPVGSGSISRKAKMDTARSELTCSLRQLIQAAEFCLKFGGDFFLVHKPERTAEIIYTLKEFRLEPKAIRFVKYHSQDAPNLVLVSAKKGGKPNVVIQPDLVLMTDDCQETEEYRLIHGVEGSK